MEGSFGEEKMSMDPRTFGDDSFILNMHSLYNLPLHKENNAGNIEGNAKKRNG